MLTKDIENMCIVAQGPNHGPSPIPEEGKWIKAREIEHISGIVSSTNRKFGR